MAPVAQVGTSRERGTPVKGKRHWLLLIAGSLLGMTLMYGILLFIAVDMQLRRTSVTLYDAFYPEPD